VRYDEFLRFVRPLLTVLTLLSVAFLVLAAAS
jgi:uncharacterized ion transporter superfamily protein YfcC